MKTTVENLDPSRIKLTVEVPYEELKPSLDVVPRPAPMAPRLCAITDMAVS